MDEAAVIQPERTLETLNHEYANALARIGEMVYRKSKVDIEIEAAYIQVDALQKEAAELNAKKQAAESTEAPVLAEVSNG